MIKRSFIDHLPNDSKPKFFPINTEKAKKLQMNITVLKMIDQFDLALLGLGR